jgi:hypothetical protein
LALVFFCTCKGGMLITLWEGGGEERVEEDFLISELRLVLSY